MNTGALRLIAQIEQPADQPPPVPSTWLCAALSDTAGAVLLAGRFHPAVTVHTRLIVKGHVYQVDHVSNRQERDADMVATCREVFD